MKHSLLLLFSASSLLFADPSANYVNFVRQVQADGSGEWDLWGLDPQGQATSPEGVGDSGSNFELWSIFSPTGAQFPLDSKFVSAYTPSATLTVFTGDPYPERYRTRADKGFTLQTHISGLAVGATYSDDDGGDDVPAAVRKVVYQHKTYTYPEGTSSLAGAGVTPEILDQRFIVGNGGYPGSSVLEVFPVTNIPSNNLPQVHGEEHFTISALADHNLVESVIESAVIQVWPMASGTISGLGSSEPYVDVPPLTIEVFDLYPSSTTWVQVFPGSANSNPAAENITIINDTEFVWDEDVSTNRTMTISSLDDVLTQHGLHTIQIIHLTPWGEEVLDEEEFELNRKVRIRSTLTTK